FFRSPLSCAASRARPRSSASQPSTSESLVFRALREPPRELAEAPRVDEGGRLRPRGRLVLERGNRRGRIERRDPPVEAQLLRVGREATRLERRLERAVLGEDLRGLLRTHSGRAREPVG